MSATDPLIGKILGDYTIQRLLSRGGMSRVYIGYDTNLDRYAAVKVISGDFATTSEEEYTRRFQSEARAIARLRHPNIVGVYQFGRTESTYYMAQVFLEGKDLHMRLKDYAQRQQRMPLDETLRIIRDVASALDYAHEQGVIHRDIKPSNIMLEQRTGRAILMDFGLALSVHEGTTGDTFGSAHYIAPEQAVSSARAVPQSDLYSLGIVIYEILSGRVPFDDPSVMSVALKHLNEPPPPPTMYNPDLPPAVETVILRVLNKDPQRRHATGQELVDDLEKAFQAQPVATLPDLTAPVVPADTSDVFASSPTTATTPADSGQLQGVAGRFARYKARKEEEKRATQPMDAADLPISDDVLSSILNQMPDLDDIGAVNNDTPTVAIPDNLTDDEIRLPEKKKRRSRVGLLLAVLLLLVIIVGGLWIGTQQGDETANGDQNIISADITPTETVTPDITNTPTPKLTTALTLIPTRTATSIATTEPTPEHTADIRLVYNADQLLLINISEQVLDVSNLAFEQQVPDGTTRTFEASRWDRQGVLDAPSQMRPQGCYQIVANATAPDTRDRALCANFLGYFATSITERFFWISDQPGATFMVYDAVTDTLLVTCDIDRGDCTFSLSTP